ncbi:bromodomain adjacent to zinc finger domain protein 1A isoform X2 [Cimex lectularius]|uniref:Bromodomain adjacent to zinc finger domain protein 1A n=1 Tax=Cimex lectularius TaxID=79782 RepID=A0A8I6S265_CIMLE|nr:bromodomain adjacent to zinc finger domain protein 1A isoform X2 [Cimex lectularius]
MPLLHKKTFEPIEFPDDLKESEEVFFCRTTGEIFRDYDEFCERIILCNSLVWSCSLTGRALLTYQEAKASEEKIKKLLKRFPMELRIPVLYLASICERRSLIELAEEVFNYVKDRYFIGETVQVNIPGAGNVDCHVLAVVPPTTEELAALSRKSHNDRHYPPAKAYKYEVERHDNGKEIIATQNQITRPKSSYNKDKNRLYIKQFVHLENNFWKLKESSNAKYGINKVKFDQIFCGEPPDMNPRESLKRKYSDRPKKQETLNAYFKLSEKKYSMLSRKNPKKGESINDLKKVRKKRLTKKLEGGILAKNSVEIRQKRRLEMKEKTKKYAEFVKEWNMKREDLECEDLKDMPSAIPIEGKIPNEHFGSVIMIMEFLQSFRKIIALKDFFPNGVTLELMERALLEKEVAGPLCDIIQLLLSAIFDLRDQEEETKDADVKLTHGLSFSRGNSETMKILKMATMTDNWIKRYHGQYLTQLTLNTSTLSEVLRLHLLTSGSKPQKSKTAKWRYQSRGGYMNNDDPGVILKLTEPMIIKKLGDTSVGDLNISEKLTIIECLINQVLTYASAREIIEEGCEKARQAKIEIRLKSAKQAKIDKAEAIKQKELKKEGGAEIEGKDKDKKEETMNDKPGKDTEINALHREMREALAGVQLMPLGTDRAHRRFWTFPTFPGLFVEDNDPFKGGCLPKCTPSVSFNIFSDGDDISYLKRLFEESGNKENFAGKHQTVSVSSHSKKLLTEKNSSDSPIMNRTQKVETASSNRPLTCWADPVNCPVHGTAANKVIWSFFKEASEVENLINSLNRRGVRERRLRQILIQEKDKIIQSLKNCPVDKLNPALACDETVIELRSKNVNKLNKLYENANLDFPPGTPLDEIMESSVRDYILEMENKITMGALGTLKVKEIDVWRDAISNNSYDKQCKKLVWGSLGDDDSEDSDHESKTDETEVKDEESEPMDVEEKEDSESRSSTPSIEVRLDSSLRKGFEMVPQRPVILDLASAILQLSQAVDIQYLKRPLGFDPKERDKDKFDLTSPTPTMLRWEKALMESTNFSQLFLHLSTLENSILWEKSASKAYCRLCRSKADPENMLLCDTCNKGHHLYCLKPKLTKVPAGDWHCPRCRPKEKFKRKKKLNGEYEEEEEVSLEDCSCKICDKIGAQIKCDNCKSKLHLACVNPPLRRVPQTESWICHLCRVHNSQIQLAKKESIEIKSESNSPVSVKEKEPKSDSKQRVKKEPKVEEKSVKKNGLLNNSHYDDFVCEWRGSERLSPDIERASRRKSSKAATAKISLFAKQLRSTHWDDDGVFNDKEPMRSGRRSRRYLESVKKSRDLPLDNAALQEILNTLMHQEEAWPFLRPVTKVEVPDYHEIIKKPMDFGTIKHKLNMLEYSKNSELIADAHLLFENCSTYNQEGSEVYRAGEKLKALFERLCQEHNLLADSDDVYNPPKRSRSVLT